MVKAIHNPMTTITLGVPSYEDSPHFIGLHATPKQEFSCPNNWTPVQPSSYHKIIRRLKLFQPSNFRDHHIIHFHIT